MLSVKTILFVENDLVSQSMYQKRLEREGYHVECARDGQVALNILSERTPDLVLLDLMLPKVSGADVLKYMQADPRLTTIPVIIFSNAPLTEVPPDSPLAQGTKRLLKSDCTFPTLLGTIQESLAQAPEFVVVEAGNLGSASPSANGNGGLHRNGSTAVAADPKVEVAAMKKRTEFLKEAAAMIPKIREHSMGYIKAPNSEASKTHLSGLHQRVHLLNSSASQADCARVALLTNAFDALLCGIMDKPTTVTPSVLQTIAQAVDCLDNLLKNTDGYSAGPAFQAKVLVVDDDTVCNHVNVTSLKRANFEAVGVKEPAAALSLLESTAFDLVVLDVNMPGMTGFDVCEKIRRLPQCKKTPVIFVTAFSNFDNRKQSVLSGGNDFVSKPVSPLELALKVTVNLIKARVKGGANLQLEIRSTTAKNGNGSAETSQAAHPIANNQPHKSRMQPPEIPNRAAPGLEHETKDARLTAPLRMNQPASEPPPQKAPDAALESKTPEQPSDSDHPEKQDMDIHDRLQQSSAALERAKAGLEHEARERMRAESQWRDQLSSAEALVKQTETVIKEKDARCNQLEKELGALRQERDELKTTLGAEQQNIKKTQQELKDAKTSLEKLSAERTRLETESREQLTAAKESAARTTTALQEKESRCGQLEKELGGLRQTQDELQKQFIAEQQTAAKLTEETKELKGNLEKVSAERAQTEAGLREQLSAAQSANAQTTTALKEKETRCGQLEKEVSGLRQTQDELQKKFAAEQQTAAKLTEETKELKGSLEQMSAERARTEAGLREQLNAAQKATVQTASALKEKETHCGQLEKELAGLQHVRDDLQNKLVAEQQAVARSQQAITESEERLRQTSAELDRVKGDLEKLSADRARLEAESREELDAAKAAAARTDAMLAEKSSRCSQLEKELAGAQQTQEQLQNQIAGEHQNAAKARQEIKELQEGLQQNTAELERTRKAWENESGKRAHLESEHQRLLETKEALNSELQSLRENQAAQAARLQDRQKKFADGLRENIRLLQLRLQEAETFNREPAEVADGDSQGH